MADKKSVGHAYNVDFLNVVFAASSLFLFLSVIWMVWDDFDREWKKKQREFTQLETQVTQASLQQAGRTVDKNKLAALTAREAAAKKNVAANQAKVDELQAKLKDAENKLFRATTAFQTMKATYDQDRYDFEATRANGLPFAKKEALAKDGNYRPVRQNLDRLQEFAVVHGRSPREIVRRLVQRDRCHRQRCAGGRRNLDTARRGRAR